MAFSSARQAGSNDILLDPLGGQNFWNWGPLTPKNFGVPKRDFFIVRCKKMKIEKTNFWGGPPPPSTLLPKLKSTPCRGLNIVWKFQAATTILTTILTRYISPRSCSPLYNSGCWTSEYFHEMANFSYFCQLWSHFVKIAEQEFFSKSLNQSRS